MAGRKDAPKGFPEVHVVGDGETVLLAARGNATEETDAHVRSCAFSLPSLLGDPVITAFCANENSTNTQEFTVYHVNVVRDAPARGRTLFVVRLVWSRAGIHEITEQVRYHLRNIVTTAHLHVVGRLAKPHGAKPHGAKAVARKAAKKNPARRKRGARLAARGRAV
ncbi:MAG: hypothetical protein FJX69_04025 [Alphaproteobacteria bacterium]|nr:hypothetical protein [Alphaproteobacteria bacterium]